MNWSRVKTILIAMIFCVDAYLGYMLVRQYRAVYYIDGTMEKDTISLLAEDGISVGEDAIPPRKLSAGVYECSFGDDYYTNLVAALASTDQFTSYTTNEGIRCQIGDNGDVYQFLNDEPFYLSYVSGDLDAGAVEKYASGQDGTAGLPEVGKFGRARAASALKAYLFPDKSALSSEHISLSVDRGYYDRSLGLYIVSASEKIDEIPLEGASFTALLSGSSVRCLQGTFIWQTSPSYYDVDLMDQLNILYKEKAYLDSSTDAGASEDGNAAAENSRSIVSMAGEYCVNWNSRRDKYYLIPSWKIKFADGSVRLRNSVNGAVYSG